ncbi:IclR family transcriptional regulator [[Pseudomonas] carboxydohydrogena]|uniref:IclR family transcriptional regulator n=1 Tax=Afipia carboxydohydrogena TaxID=290 RepID=A0ABY8BPT5_AFICR|nr:IclR family transcriptional regulator [[Pseudomonas] carboxydohydrogena]WEF50939.1 IclR family transcriptional regulator [[Pseudomonas] carboxydohydrogena]
MDTTFLKGLRMLQALSLSDRPRGVTDLARELGLTKSNSHRLLKTLVHAGYAQNNSETAKYSATLKVWELGSHVLSKVDVKSAASAYLQPLADKTGESVHLSLLVENSVVYIDKIDSAQPVRAYSQIGKGAPAYCVATGKALLAFQGEDAIARVSEKLEVHTPRTITDSDEFKREMARVRQLGYAINRGEWREGVCGVGAPIRDSSRQVIAAVGISGPESRMKPTFMREQALIVIQTADLISKALGYPGDAVAYRKTA